MSHVATGVREVRLLGIPPDLLDRAVGYHEELERECVLVLSRHPDAHAGPSADVVRTAALLRECYRHGQLDTGPRRREGATPGTVDVVRSMPSTAADDARRLQEVFDAAEELCRQGRLLTVAPSGEVSSFRRWYLDEVVRQVGGEGPTAWRRP